MRASGSLVARAEPRGDALAQLGRCLARERQHQDLLGVETVLDARHHGLDDGGGLAGARPGQHQQRPAPVVDDPLLRLVEDRSGHAVGAPHAPGCTTTRARRPHFAGALLHPPSPPWVHPITKVGHNLCGMVPSAGETRPFGLRRSPFARKGNASRHQAVAVPAGELHVDPLTAGSQRQCRPPATRPAPRAHDRPAASRRHAAPATTAPSRPTAT